MTAPTRLTDVGVKLVKKALQKEQDVRWELSLSAYPDPSAPPALQDGAPSDPSVDTAFVPTLLLYLEIPCDADRFVYGVTILPPFGLDQSTVDEAVRDALETLRTRKDAVLDSEY